MCFVLRAKVFWWSDLLFWSIAESTNNSVSQPLVAFMLSSVCRQGFVARLSVDFCDLVIFTRFEMWESVALVLFICGVLARFGLVSITSSNGFLCLLSSLSPLTHFIPRVWCFFRFCLVLARHKGSFGLILFKNQADLSHKP